MDSRSTGTYCPRLIEVALPIREISAESVRDKNIDHGHISRLHVWWARRPLAASRAVVFASLVPDPDDPRCPEDFRATVERHLKTHVPAALKHFRRGREDRRDEDPYHPYEGIPDTLRNRLLMFVAKWSPESIAFEAGKAKKEPDPKYLLDDRSLVKWETSDPDNRVGREVLRIARELVRAASGNQPPTVLDPFAGGGAIPLEAGRLGCQVVANDYNPVAHLILRATCEYPQKYGKPGKRKVLIGEFGNKVEREIQVPNVLVHDLEVWANWVLEQARERIGHLYPAGQDGRPVLAYLWARTVPCSNPACRGELPLLRSLSLCTRGRKIALKARVDRAAKHIDLDIARDEAVKSTEGTKRQRGSAMCPFCDQPITEPELREAGINGTMGERMVAVVLETNGRKDYRAVDEEDLKTFSRAAQVPVQVPAEYIVPEINGPAASPKSGSHRSINLELYGLKQWGQLFNRRQLVVMNELVRCLHEALDAMQDSVEDSDYRRALAVYLAFWIDRVGMFGNSMCRWDPTREAIKTPFSGQSVPMMWDYPEMNPFADSSAAAVKQLARIAEVLLREASGSSELGEPAVSLGSATDLPIASNTVSQVVTDPPYGNSIAYADLSDFFYVWLKRSLAGIAPEVFRTPQSPREHEATSHKHRHEGSQEEGNKHYQRLLTASFVEAQRVAREPKLIAVMFAHQSTDAWTALLNALFDSGLSPISTWPIATEKPDALMGMGGANLESSITVVCRPRVVGSAASFKAVRAEIEDVVRRSVKRFWSYGFRGADLIVACYGPAVGVFGKYERVEKADGTRVGIPELLELAKQAARDAIAGEFRGDGLSTLYYVWANLYGAAEQAWDDARLVVQIGGDEDNAMEVARGQGIFVVDGARCRLALLADRAGRRDLGLASDSPHIDALHRSMLLWKGEQRAELVHHLAERDLFEDEPFWKLAQALFEVLPRDLEDWKLVSALLSERPTLRAEAKREAFKESEQRLF